MEKQKLFHVAVVGATGAVGEQMLNTLEKTRISNWEVNVTFI